MELRLPPKMPQELLNEAHARFEEAVTSLTAMSTATPPALLVFLHAAGELVAAMEYDRRSSALHRHFGMRTTHALATRLGEPLALLTACAALYESYSADELHEIAGRARSWEELADLVDMEDPEMAKRLWRRLSSAARNAR